MLLGEMYAFPFECVAEGMECDAIRLPPERKALGAAALAEVLKAYGGDWLKWVPLANLVAVLAGDAMGARRRYKAQEREAAEAAIRARLEQTAPPAPAAPSPN